MLVEVIYILLISIFYQGFKSSELGRVSISNQKDKVLQLQKG